MEAYVAMRFIPRKKPDLSLGIDERFYEVFPLILTLAVVDAILEGQVIAWLKFGSVMPFKSLISLLSWAVLAAFAFSVFGVISERLYYRDIEKRKRATGNGDDLTHHTSN